MRDDFFLGASKGGQAEDGIQDGKGSGGDVTPLVEDTGTIRIIAINRCAVEGERGLMSGDPLVFIRNRRI